MIKAERIIKYIDNIIFIAIDKTIEEVLTKLK